MSANASRAPINCENLVRHYYADPAEVAEARALRANQHLLSPYKLKIYRDDGAYFLGRFSSEFLYRGQDFVTYLENASLKLGSFVQGAGDLRILCGGEHSNQRPININLATANMELAILAGQDGLSPDRLSYGSKGEVVIGNDVVINRGAMILSGVTIGNGAVIGAGSIVSSDVPPFAIVAGNPARVIAYRFDSATIARLERLRWWDLSYEFLVRHIGKISALGVTEFIDFIEASEDLGYDPHEKRYIAIKIERGQLKLRYYYDGRQKRDCGENYFRYFQQSATDKIRVDEHILYAVGPAANPALMNTILKY